MSIIKLQGQEEISKGIYYEVDTSSEPIGIGGMGRVYRGVCVNERTNEMKPVAIKFMYEDLPEQAIEKARREASIQLRNDNLVEMLGFIETEYVSDNGATRKHYHVVSELLHGVSLSDILQGKNLDFEGNVVSFANEMLQILQTRPELFARRIIKSILSGLTALHDKGYIHRDIDPTNIILTSDNNVKLIDFGIANKMDALRGNISGSFTPDAYNLGKPGYAAPELVRGDVFHQNGTTDIYAVGILLFQLVCGHLPFQGPAQEVKEAQLKKNMPLSEIKDPALRQVIRKATQKEQSRRFQSASEFRVALDSTTISQNNIIQEWGAWVGAAIACGTLFGTLLALFL